MRKLRYVAVAIALVSLPLVAACGAESNDTRARQPTSPYSTNRPPGGVPTETEVGPTPQNMPGGGRGSDPPHFKGKP